MKHIFIFLLLFSSSCYAQLAVVDDVDGFVNIRAEKSKTAAVTDTLHAGQLVCMADTTGDWFWVSQCITGKNGYVHRSRLKPVHKMEAEEQRKILVQIFNHYISYVSKVKRGIIAETDRSSKINERMEAAMGSMVLAWPMNPDTVTLHAVFKALAVSGGSASEQRTWLAARCAAQNPELFRYILCHESDAVRNEVWFTVTTGLAMNTLQQEFTEPYPAIHFREQEANEVRGVLKASCSSLFQNRYDVEKITSVQQRKEYSAILYEGMESPNDTIPKFKLEKGGSLTVSGDTGTISAFGYTFSLLDKPFAATSHVLFYNDNPRRMLNYIDAAPFWGTDGDVPGRELVQLRVTFKGSVQTYGTYVIRGLYEPNHRAVPSSEFQHVQIYRSADKKRVYLRMYGGDGAGGYVCVWQFNNGAYNGRVIDHGF